MAADILHRVDLPRIYATGEFADCVFVAADGTEFPAHRLVVGRFPRLKALLAQAQDRRVSMDESKDVVDRLLKWVYGLDWDEGADDLSVEGLGKTLGAGSGLVEAAEKVRSPLRDRG